MDELMQVVAICEQYGWTYQEYEQQPAFFITLIKERMRIDTKAQELEAKRQYRG
jgi:hypothetical protein